MTTTEVTRSIDARGMPCPGPLMSLIGAMVAVVLSNWLQRFISDPILQLALTAQNIADHNDYSVRTVEAKSGTELGTLTRTFNKMLARIQQQDEAITLSQQQWQPKNEHGEKEDAAGMPKDAQ